MSSLIAGKETYIITLNKNGLYNSILKFEDGDYVIRSISEFNDNYKIDSFITFKDQYIGFSFDRTFILSRSKYFEDFTKKVIELGFNMNYKYVFDLSTQHITESPVSFKEFSDDNFIIRYLIPYLDKQGIYFIENINMNKIINETSYVSNLKIKTINGLNKIEKNDDYIITKKTMNQSVVDSSIYTLRKRKYFYLENVLQSCESGDKKKFSKLIRDELLNKKIGKNARQISNLRNNFYNKYKLHLSKTNMKHIIAICDEVL